MDLVTSRNELENLYLPKSCEHVIQNVPALSNCIQAFFQSLIPALGKIVCIDQAADLYINTSLRYFQNASTTF